MPNDQVEVPIVSPPLQLEVDLTPIGVLQHFSKMGNPRLLNFLMSLDRVDKWTVDYDEGNGPQVFEVQAFLTELSELVSANAMLLHRVPREMTELLAHISTSRCVYLMQLIIKADPRLADTMAQLFESEVGREPDARTIQRRLDVLARAELLSDVFSSSRLVRIARIMGAYSNV